MLYITKHNMKPGERYG